MNNPHPNMPRVHVGIRPEYDTDGTMIRGHFIHRQPNGLLCVTLVEEDKQVEQRFNLSERRAIEIVTLHYYANAEI